MFSNKIRTAVVALAGVAALALPAIAFAQNPLEWRTYQGSSLTGQPFDSGTYTLANLQRSVRVTAANGVSYADTSQDLVYGNQTFGVDLDWYTPRFDDLTDPPRGRGVQWKFVRQHRGPFHQISGTERVGLYNTANHQYLAEGIEPCHCGVKLVFSATPRYEWQVATGELNGPAYGSFTQLYNTTEQAYLVNGHQTWGVDLVWLHAPYGLPYGYEPPQPLWGTVNPVGSLPVKMGSPSTRRTATHHNHHRGR